MTARGYLPVLQFKLNKYTCICIFIPVTADEATLSAALPCFPCSSHRCSVSRARCRSPVASLGLVSPGAGNSWCHPLTTYRTDLFRSESASGHSWQITGPYRILSNVCKFRSYIYKGHRRKIELNKVGGKRL